MTYITGIITDNTIKLRVDISKPLHRLYIDIPDSSLNWKSNKAEDHSLTLAGVELDNITTLYEDRIEYNVPISTIDQSQFDKIFVVTGVISNIDKESLIVFSDDLFYSRRFNVMSRINTLDEDLKGIDRLEVLMFKEIMFRESVALRRIDDAIRFYLETKYL